MALPPDPPQQNPTKYKKHLLIVKIELKFKFN